MARGIDTELDGLVGDGCQKINWISVQQQMNMQGFHQ